MHLCDLTLISCKHQCPRKDYRTVCSIRLPNPKNCPCNDILLSHTIFVWFRNKNLSTFTYGFIHKKQDKKNITKKQIRTKNKILCFFFHLRTSPIFFSCFCVFTTHHERRNLTTTMTHDNNNNKNSTQIIKQTPHQLFPT